MSGSGSMKSKNILYYIHVAIYLLISFGFGFLPPIGAITHFGMQGLGIFLGLLYGWIFLDMLWPSLLVFAFIPLLGKTTITDAVAAGFGANLTVQIFLLLTLAAYFEKSGLTEYLANWFVSRKIAIGRPWVLVSLIMLCAFVLSAFTFIYASIVVMWGITYHMADIMGYKRQDKFIAVILIGIALAAASGAIAMPFQIMGAITLGALASAAGISVNLFKYICFCVPYSLLVSAMYLLICKFCIKCDVEPLKNKADIFGYLRNQKMNRTQKESGIVLILFLLVLLLPCIIPHDGGILQILGDYGVTGCTCLTLGLMAIPRKNDGEAYLSISSFIRSGVNWELYILLAATTPIVNLIESDDAGILASLTEVLTPIVSNMSPFICMVFICIFVYILAQFSHNVVLIMLFVPLLLPIITPIGVSPVVTTFVIALASQHSLMTPAASGQAAMCFGNKEWIKTSDCYKLSAVASTSAAAMVIILLPIMMQMF